MASKGWKIVQAHIPLIRFRKGGNSRVAQSAAVNSSRSDASEVRSFSKVSGPNVFSLPLIDDFELPDRFRRQPIGEQEMEYINRGGPE